MFILLCVILLFIIFIYLIGVRKKKIHNLPPVMDGAIPIFGHAIAALGFKKNLYDLFMIDFLQNARKKGLEAFTIDFCIANWYVICDVDDAYLVSSECLNKDLIFKFFSPWFSDYGLLSCDEPVWKKHRKLLNPTFNQKVLTGFLMEMNIQYRKLIDDFAKHYGKDPFDHFVLIKKRSFETLAATTMGASVDEEDRKLKETFIELSETFTDGIIERTRRFWLVSDFIFQFTRLKWEQARKAKILNEIADKIIQKKRNEKNNLVIYSEDELKKKYKASLDHLLELSEQGLMNDQEIREEVGTFLTAGIDTTSAGITIALLVIGSKPDVQKRVHEELDKVFGDSDRDIEREDLNNTVYLEAVIKETMRMYPLTVGSMRYIHKDMKLKTYTIPAGSRCLIAFSTILRSSLWGPDAEVFDADRWLDSNRLPKNPNAYPIFGMSKRSCIGMSYAMMSIKTALIHILRRYKVNGDVSKLKQKIDFVTRPVSGYWISVEKKC